MTDADLIALARAYFRALDARDPGALAATLSEECVMRIETHGIVYEGRDTIRDLFAERWRGPLVSTHHSFTHSPSAATGRITSQFTVSYDGPEAPDDKSNANVFTITGTRISAISVYMAGANTIRT